MCSLWRPLYKSGKRAVLLEGQAVSVIGLYRASNVLCHSDHNLEVKMPLERNVQW
jgi:hypothetical protein